MSITAYLQHGKAGQAQSTQSVPVEHSPTVKPVKGQVAYQVLAAGRWRRVKRDSEGTFITLDSERVRVLIILHEKSDKHRFEVK